MYSVIERAALPIPALTPHPSCGLVFQRVCVFFLYKRSQALFSFFSLSSLASTDSFFPCVPKVAPRFLTKQLVVPLFLQKPTLFPSVPLPSPPGPIGSALSSRSLLPALRRWRGTPGPHHCCLINSFHHVNQKKPNKKTELVSLTLELLSTLEGSE